MFRVQLLFVGAVLTAAVGLGSPQAATAEGVRVEAATPSGGSESAAVMGEVTLIGKPPKRRPINMSADPGCQSHQAKPSLPEDIVVGPEGVLRNVVVYIKQGLPNRSYEPPQAPVAVEQVQCTYRPRVFAAMVGQPVVIRNGDATLHNIHGFPVANPTFNMAQPAQGMQDTLVFRRAEPGFPIKCDVHPWMTTFCWVFDHPFHAVTSEDGKFSISGLPPGDYVIEAWHETLGTRSEAVTLTAGESKQIGFTFEITKK